MSRNLLGYIVRTTEMAVAYVDGTITEDAKPLWIPLSKILENEELDLVSRSFQLKGEKVNRQGVPVELVVDSIFLEKIGI